MKDICHWSFLHRTCSDVIYCHLTFRKIIELSIVAGCTLLLRANEKFIFSRNNFCWRKKKYECTFKVIVKYDSIIPNISRTLVDRLSNFLSREGTEQITSTIGLYFYSSTWTSHFLFCVDGLLDRLDWEGTVKNQLHYFLNTAFSKTLWITFPNSEDFFGESRTLSGIWTVSLLGIISLCTNQIKTLIAHLSQGFSLSNFFPQAWPLSPSPPVGRATRFMFQLCLFHLVLPFTLLLMALLELSREHV